MKILVTGTAGFLGFHIARALADEGHIVVCVDNGIRGEFDKYYEDLAGRANVEDYRIDLNDLNAVQNNLPDDIDVVYHMAALNGTQNFYERPFEVIKCCTLPTLNLLQKYGPLGRLKRFIYAGTSESYASTVTRFNWPVPTAEDVPLGIDDVFNPRWSYAAGKMHGEIATITGCNQYGLDHTIIRYHNAYGPRMGDKHVIPDFYIRAKEGAFALYGYEDTRSFIYVDDAVRATIGISRSDIAKGEVINIGGSQEITMLALGEEMMRVAGLTGQIECHPSPKGSVKRRCPDVAKLKGMINFSEEWTLEAGLQKTAEFYLYDKF